MDLAVTNGTVYTGGELVSADVGVADGEIAAVGDVGDADRTIDASGSLVLPGLINAHTHSPMTLLRGYADDLPFDEWFEDRIRPVEAHFDRDAVAAGARLATLEMIKTGTTAFCDMYGNMDAVAEAVEASGLRATLGQGVIAGDTREETEDNVAASMAFAREYDGAADGRIRTAVMPHAPYTCPDWVLTELAEQAVAEDLIFHVHLNETAGEVEGLTEEYGRRPVHHLDDLGCWDPSGFVAHAVHVDDAEIDRLAERGIGVAHCPSANLKLGAGIAPVADLVAAGVPTCIGTDGPASNNDLDLVTELRFAALLAKGATRDASVVPAERAIAMATSEAADLLGYDAGRIEVGRPADLVVIDGDSPQFTPGHDLLSHAVYAATGRDVTATIVDGEVLMADGEVETIDEDRVVAEAQAAADDLLARHRAAD